MEDEPGIFHIPPSFSEHFLSVKKKFGSDFTLKGSEGNDAVLEWHKLGNLICLLNYSIYFPLIKTYKDN